MPVTWEGENDRKVLLYILMRFSSKDINFEYLSTIIPGATPKAVLEHVAKLRREAKSIEGLTEATANGSAASGNDASPTPSLMKAGQVGTGKPRGRPKKAISAVGVGGKRKRSYILGAEDFDSAGGGKEAKVGDGKGEDDDDEDVDTKKFKVEESLDVEEKFVEDEEGV